LRVLAVDPGDKRIGLAISDPTGTISRPLTVIHHKSRAKDAQRITTIAQEEGVGLIVVGWALDSEGRVGYRARKSRCLAETIQDLTDIPLMMWDESGTTQAAIQSRIDMGINRKKRQGHLDDVAASILLQDFLMSNEDIVRKEDDDYE
jgi:putative Holliday junction resolvase